MELKYDKNHAKFLFKADLGSIASNKFRSIPDKKIANIQFFAKGKQAVVHILNEYFITIFSKNVIINEFDSWNIINLLNDRIIIEGVFFVGIEWTDNFLLLGVDNEEPYYDRSYLGVEGNAGPPRSKENYLIRVNLCDSYLYDAFICHASEDKEEFVRPLAIELRKNAKIWYDEFSLKIGDSLRRKIDRGLLDSRYGIVILSHHFFDKKWPNTELDGLVARDDGKENMILPIWYKVSKQDVVNYSPSLADKIALTDGIGLDNIVKELLKVIKPLSLYAHLHAVFFYDENVSYEKLQRDPYLNSPRNKAIVNSNIKKAFYMTDYAQKLFFEEARGKIDFYTQPWKGEEEFKNHFRQKGIELIEKPAKENDLFTEV